METFLYCDLFQYELSARGEMRGHDVDSLVDAIDHLPRDSAATVDLRQTSMIDAPAARELSRAVDRRQRDGIEFTIIVQHPAIRAELTVAGVPHVNSALAQSATPKSALC